MQVLKRKKYVQFHRHDFVQLIDATQQLFLVALGLLSGTSSPFCRPVAVCENDKFSNFLE